MFDTLNLTRLADQTSAGPLNVNGANDRASCNRTSRFGHTSSLGPTPPANIYEGICWAFRNENCTLSSPTFSLNQAEFNRILRLVANFKTRIPKVKTVEWHLERGEASSSQSSPAGNLGTNWHLACYMLSKNHYILRKLVISNLQSKLLVPKVIAGDQNKNLNLLRTITPDLANAFIKDQYEALRNHVKLENVVMTDYRIQLIAVVTSVNKTPTRMRNYWHSYLCISDPSLVGPEESVAPTEFKMHLFMPSHDDFPEVHRGDVVRFNNVKIESHLNRCDGRIFKKDDLTVYCHWDDQAPVPPRMNCDEERAVVVRLLSKWWKINHKFFDVLTPWPIYHAHSRYPGIRSFRELSNQLVCDAYCQVARASSESQDLNFLCVWDGTIFTLEDQREPPPPDAPETPENQGEEEKKTYGYLALIVFDRDHWNRIRPFNIGVNDYLRLKEAKVVFVSPEVFDSIGAAYPCRYPCVLLRPSPAADGVAKIPPDHHEAVKIRSRLRRLPQALEEMVNWRLPPLPEEVPEDIFLSQLSDPEIQRSLLKRLRRF